MIERKPVAGTWKTTQKNWSFLRLYYLYIDLKFSNIESFLIKSWSEWDSNLRSREYRTHALITELSGQTMTYA